MAMKRIAAMLLTSVLLLSCVGCAQDGRKEPDAEKTDLGLTAEARHRLYGKGKCRRLR